MVPARGDWGLFTLLFLLISYLQLNHFPGSFQIGRKDRLWRNVSKMQVRFGKKEFNFLPQSFILPQDIKLLRKAWEDCAGRQKWIVKPVRVQRWSDSNMDRAYSFSFLLWSNYVAPRLIPACKLLLHVLSRICTWLISLCMLVIGLQCWMLLVKGLVLKHVKKERGMVSITMERNRIVVKY